jgi:hypothetical protein
MARFWSPYDVVKYFDAAFRLREQYPDEPVLLYALGILFKIACPSDKVGRIAQSCITQALLCEPGASQKAFALLTWWHLNGLVLDDVLIANTVNQMLIRHEAIGFSSDIAWALSFCLDQHYVLSKRAGKILSGFDDDCIALQALHMHSNGLLPAGFHTKHIVKALKDADLDREHWLLAYEALRHGFLTVSAAAVRKNPLFSDLLKRKVTFYRTSLPPYASVINAGGAPPWMVQKWMRALTGKSGPEAALALAKEESATLELIRKDLAKIELEPASIDDAVSDLIGRLAPKPDIGGDFYWPG